MKVETKIKLYNSRINILILIVSIILSVVVISFVVHGILNSYYYVETLEYVDVDCEWVNDFQNYEVCIVHEDKPHYLTVQDNKVKFIYANEGFLNFVVVEHDKRVKDKEDWYGITSFYINLNYKGEQR